MNMAASTDMKTAVCALPEPLCWICKKNKADSGEHKTKRSDLLAVLGRPSQTLPFFYSDTKRQNQVVGSLDAKILKSPVRICAYCNNARTQPHDRAWERMSDRLRSRWGSGSVVTGSSNTSRSAACSRCIYTSSSCLAA
jgi:hypothetical protein